MQEIKDRFLDKLFEKAVEDTNKKFPNDPPMKWPTEDELPSRKKRSLRVLKEKK